MAAKAGKSQVEQAADVVKKGVEKIVNTDIGVKIPHVPGSPDEATWTIHLTFRDALIAIACATLAIFFLYQAFLRSVYFQYKEDEAEKEDLDEDDSHSRPWYSGVIPQGFSLTRPFSGKAQDEDDDSDEESAEPSPKPRKSSPKASPKTRSRSRSPPTKGSSKKSR